ncbi:MAG: cell division protein SepF [Oscillospiraceae bacterium]|nr:cell division protein SepF [Oscillospiraceae bacterium]
MGLMDELRKLARPYEDEEDEYYEDEEVDVEEDDEPEEPAPRRSTFRRETRTPRETAPVRETAPREVRATSYRDGYDAPAPRGTNKVVNIAATTQLQVVLVRPEKFENASEIADHLRDKRTVVLNLENTNKDIARRLIDFLSGVAYAQEGKIKKVSAATYIITPFNVDIIGDHALIDELESSGFYF